MKKMLNEGNQIHKFISSSGSGTVINYGSGSTSKKFTIPVPQLCLHGSRVSLHDPFVSLHSLRRFTLMRIRIGCLLRYDPYSALHFSADLNQIFPK